MSGALPTMKQSGVIFGSLTIAFVVYITMKGHLPQYLALITGSGAATSTTSTTTSGMGLSPSASPSNNVAPAQPLNIGSSATAATTTSTNLSNTGMFFPTFNQVDLFGG